MQEVGALLRFISMIVLQHFQLTYIRTIKSPPCCAFLFKLSLICCNSFWCCGLLPPSPVAASSKNHGIVKAGRDPLDYPVQASTQLCHCNPWTTQTHHPVSDPDASWTPPRMVTPPPPWAACSMPDHSDSEKMFSKANLSLPCLSLRLFPLVLSLWVWQDRLTPTSLQPPFRLLYRPVVPWIILLTLPEMGITFADFQSGGTSPVSQDCC